MQLGGDTFSLHQGKYIVSNITRCTSWGHQDKVLGFQFHPECTADMFINRWQQGDWGLYEKPGAQDKATQAALAVEHDPAQHRWFTGFLDRLFGRA